MDTPHGILRLPAFMPDATRGVVRSLDAADLEQVGIAALMVNALHLSTQPGTSVVAKMGGIHRFAGWRGPVASDSGGFQVMSLATGGARGVEVSKAGFSYRLEGQKKKRTLTPETCIRHQVSLGSDIVFCLDHCTHPDADGATQRESVANTIAWAAACREAFDRVAGETDGGPLLFAVVQGGRDRDLRTRCAEGLREIGFDGYGFGGWPVAEGGGLEDAVGWVAELTPDDRPRHALGIGKPESVAAAHALGYDTYDCSLPTRDARQGRLWVSGGDAPGASRYLHVQDERFARQSGPVDAACDCPTCRRYDVAYLHHLFQIGDATGGRLATLHNLRFCARLMARLRRGRSAIT